jgi:SAM-dependent methyltransferase
MNMPAFGFPVQISKETDDAFQHGLKYLRQQQEQGVNKKFWRRFGEKPLFKNKKILELGCGFGGLSLDLAFSGAQKVVGLEIDPKDIGVARANLQKNHPELIDIIQFEQVDIADFPEADFDMVVSKDVFEHVDDLEKVLGEIKKRLKVGGYLYAGFGPLWNSPYGFHGDYEGWNFKNKYPWGHLLVKPGKIVEQYNTTSSTPIYSLMNLGLNQFSLSEYQKIIQESGLSVNFFRINHEDTTAAKMASRLCEIPVLRNFLASTIYCILKKEV